MRNLILSLTLVTCAFAQDRAGEAQIGFQHYYLTNGSRPISNALGLTLGLREFIPRLGVLTVNVAPATNNGRFQTGTSFAELKQLPWMRQYWTVRGGDFRMQGRLLQVPFNNLYYPDIAGRGASVEATHGTRTIGAFYGAETLQAGVRVPLRLITPQTMTGLYYRETFSDRLEIGARALDLSTNIQRLRETPQIAMPLNPIEHARTGMVSALYTVAGKFKWYGETAFSTATRIGQTGSNSASFNTGPVLDTSRLTLRANYTRQSDAYLPLLGYYLGDRQGSFGELRVRPMKRVEFYGSASDYRNNVRRDPTKPTYQSSSRSAGFSMSLPARFSLSGQASQIELFSKKSDAEVATPSRNRQIQVTIARRLGRHGLRASLREFQQSTLLGLQRQTSMEGADNFQLGPLSLGAQIRAQRSAGLEQRTSVFVQSNAQLTLRHFFVYANIQTGNDLANRTLFATSTMNSMVLGGATNFRNWDFSLDAYRNRLVTDLNPESIFVLQGQGVYVPSVLAQLNQWSLYFRMSKKLEWGKPLTQNVLSLDTYAAQKNLLRGAVEGFVFSEEHRGVEGVPVSIDGGPSVLTDKAGKFRMDNIGEGIHKVGLAMEELPADFDPGKITNLTLLVRPSTVSRADFDVVVVGYVLRGSVSGPFDARKNILIRLTPSGRYTTTDAQGDFSFYNVPGGKYDVELAPESLPKFAILRGSSKVAAKAGSEQDPIHFEFDIQEPPKPVKQISLPPAAAVVAPAEPAPVLRPAVFVEPERKPVAPPVAKPAPVMKQNNNPAALYAEGRALNEDEKFEEAIKKFSAAIEKQADYALAFNARGFAYLRLNQYPRATADFTEAIRLNPKYSNAFHNRAVAKRKLGDLAGAQLDDQKAQELAPKR